MEIPGTNVDEPVAQGQESSPDHYLCNDALGHSAYGTPYIDWECAPDTEYVAVYGHHMDDGSQFIDVAKFSDPGYGGEHRSIYWYTRSDDQPHELTVVTVDVLDASCETQRTSFKDDADRISHLKEKLSSSDLVLEEPDLENGQIVSFATCSYQTWNSRTIIYAEAETASLLSQGVNP